MTEFQRKHTFEYRSAESTKILLNYPNRIPIIVDTGSHLTLDKFKYLVPDNLTIGQFVYVLRKRMKLPSENAIFVFINETLPATSASIGHLYQKYKDPDGFIYFAIRLENTFG